jgi:RimJ/RimL family protein N-acetyltransferase
VLPIEREISPMTQGKVPDSEDWLDLLAESPPWSAPRPLPGPIETPRLVVRLYQRGDGEPLFRAVEASRRALLPWMAWARTDQQDVIDGIHHVERVRRKAQRPGCNDFHIGIFDRSTGDLVGSTGLHDILAATRQAEIGYWIRADRQGQGLCVEAIGALCTAALTPKASGGWGLRRLVVFMAAANTASRRVCERLGLRLEMHMRADRYLGPAGVDGAPGYHDTLGFAVLDDEWDFQHLRARPDIGWPSRP